MWQTFSTRSIAQCVIQMGSKSYRSDLDVNITSWLIHLTWMRMSIIRSGTQSPLYAGAGQVRLQYLWGSGGCTLFTAHKVFISTNKNDVNASITCGSSSRPEEPNVTETSTELFFIINLCTSWSLYLTRLHTHHRALSVVHCLIITSCFLPCFSNCIIY